MKMPFKKNPNLSPTAPRWAQFECAHGHIFQSYAMAEGDEQVCMLCMRQWLEDNIDKARATAFYDEFDGAQEPEDGKFN